MKHKKGFALATTMVAMVVVLALSNLLLGLATSSNVFAKSQTKLFEKDQQIYQISQNFADLNLTDFKIQYAEYEEENLENITILYDNNYKYTLVITTSEAQEKLEIKDYNQTNISAVIEKNNGQITVWQITN